MSGSYRKGSVVAALLVATLLVAASPGCSTRVVTSRDDPAPAHVRTVHASSLHDDRAEESDEQAWRAIAAALGKPGDLKDGVYSLVFPRDDLELTLQGNDVPAAAGIASEFRFYRCPCGRINVIGQFVVADYEANDVLDALREGRIEIASVGPLLLHERPRLLLVRFFGENPSGGALAKTLRAALAWTGKERMAPQKIE